VPLTNFALSALVATEKHAAMAAVGDEAGSAQEASSKALARLHRLHGKILPHRFGNRVNVLAGFQALLRQELNLGASAGRLVLEFL
jgi:hypothetical protein